MASELRVNTLKDAAGNNSIATSFVAGGSAKAWVQFNASTVAQGSLNISSLTDSATGKFIANINNDFANDDFAATAVVGNATNVTNYSWWIGDTISTGTLSLRTFQNNAYIDNPYNMMVFFGDLA
jgi:hypothetical protein|tara:strand:+ start:550 stop:924 length:375 start_codon:yes stop_codon:yes gene_type:complete